MKQMIKFRGRDVVTGEFRFGFYVEDFAGANILENGHAYLVDPKSVKQLVGFDCDGNEVYAGDLMIREGFEGNDLVWARFYPTATLEGDISVTFLFTGEDSKHFKLKRDN